MKNFRFVNAAVVFMSLLVFAVTAWSEDTVASGKNAQEIVGEEAIVARVGSDQVTLISATDRHKECSVPMADAGQLKEGDKVKVQGNVVMKIESTPGKAPKTP
jgi:hypothetical protein